MKDKSAFDRGNFLKGESGAVTVDWVVLTAAIVGMGIAVLTPIAFSSESSAQRVGSYIQNTPIGFRD